MHAGPRQPVLDRLLNAYLAGAVGEEVFRAKTEQLRAESKLTEEALSRTGEPNPARADVALAVFNFSQKAADIWRGSSNAVRREILDAVCLNRMLDDATLVTTKRKPFDVLAERPFLKKSRGDWHSFEPSAPMVRGYLAAFVGAGELHLPMVVRLARLCA